MEYGKLSCKVKIKPVRQVCIVETCNHQDLPEYWRTPKKLSFVCESGQMVGDLSPLEIGLHHGDNIEVGGEEKLLKGEEEGRAQPKVI